MYEWIPSVLRERRVGVSRVHPAEKPVPLLRRLIRLLAPPGGTVLDPFAGSASTGQAAFAEGREFLGIELDAAYAERAANQESITQLGLI
jgi:site-specific DNA-methyltransferase (adenine-specific)